MESMVNKLKCGRENPSHNQSLPLKNERKSKLIDGECQAWSMLSLMMLRIVIYVRKLAKILSHIRKWSHCFLYQVFGVSHGRISFMFSEN